MSDKERTWEEKLTRHLVYLQNHLQVNSGFLACLQAASVLTQLQCDEIRSKCPSDKVYDLVHLLKKKSEKEYKRFMWALVTTNQQHVAMEIEGETVMERKYNPQFPAKSSTLSLNLDSDAPFCPTIPLLQQNDNLPIHQLPNDESSTTGTPLTGTRSDVHLLKSPLSDSTVNQGTCLQSGTVNYFEGLREFIKKNKVAVATVSGVVLVGLILAIIIWNNWPGAIGMETVHNKTQLIGNEASAEGYPGTDLDDQLGMRLNGQRGSVTTQTKELDTNEDEEKWPKTGGDPLSHVASDDRYDNPITQAKGSRMKQVLEEVPMFTDASINIYNGGDIDQHAPVTRSTSNGPNDTDVGSTFQAGTSIRISGRLICPHSPSKADNVRIFLCDRIPREGKEKSGGSSGDNFLARTTSDINGYFSLQLHRVNSTITGPHLRIAHYCRVARESPFGQWRHRHPLHDRLNATLNQLDVGIINLEEVTSSIMLRNAQCRWGTVPFLRI